MLINMLINEYKEKRIFSLKTKLNALGHLNINVLVTNLLSSRVTVRDEDGGSSKSKEVPFRCPSTS